MAEYTLDALEHVNFKRVPLRDCIHIKNALLQDMQTAKGERKKRLEEIEKKINQTLFGGWQ